MSRSFSYPEPILRAVNGARQGALAKSISNWHLIGHNEGCCSNTGYILLPCFYGIRLWIWPEPLVAPRVRRALGTRMMSRCSMSFSYPEPILRAVNGARQGALAKSISNWHLIGHNEGCCSNTGYILLPCFYGIRLWIWPEPLVAPRVRRALGTRMCSMCDAEKDWHERAFRQKLTRSVIFPAVVFSLFFHQLRNS